MSGRPRPDEIEVCVSREVLAEDRGVGECREDDDGEDADEPEAYELLLWRRSQPQKAEVRLVLGDHRARGRLCPPRR